MHRSLCLFVALTALSTDALAQTKPPSLVDLLRDKGCSIVLEQQRNDWRDAALSDYQTSGWKAWMAQTGVRTPWRAVGDYDGDGLEDVAKIVIRKADEVWMLGVEFGYKNPADCRRQQIAMNSNAPEARLLGLQPLPLPAGRTRFVCHHISESMPASCNILADSALGKRKTDAFIAADDVPSRMDGYLWGPFGAYKKSDGTPQMTFNSAPITPQADLSAVSTMAASTLAKQGETQANDQVGKAQRTALIAEFDAAFDQAKNRSHRTRSVTVVTQAGAKFESTNITDFLPPDRWMITSGDVNAQASVVVIIGDRTWERGQGGRWAEAEVSVPMLAGLGAQIGARGITAVRSETIGGVAVKTIDCADPPGENAGDSSLSINTRTGLPVRRIDRVPAIGMVNTTDYDFDAQVQIPDPRSMGDQ